MEDLELLIELHRPHDRQGPGGIAETNKAIQLAGLDQSSNLNIADIGCGTGASALQLASTLNAHVTAIDFLPEFIDTLKQRANDLGIADQIKPMVGPMEDLPFKEGEFDVIWSEGAIYNMGFEKGVKEWQRFLKPSGLLVVSEITWLTDKRPEALDTFWNSQYPEIGTASEKMAILEKANYSPLGYFTLPEHCWLENYYEPLQKSFADFLASHADDKNAGALVQAEKEEIALYQRYKAYYSYGVYIAKNLEESA